MNDVQRDRRVIDSFATLADTLVDDYDVVELLQTLVETCTDVFEVDAAAIMLADEEGRLDVVASTSEESRLIEVLQLGAAGGPCTECFRTGAVVSIPDIATAPGESVAFRSGATALGFRSVHAVPLRLRARVIGTLNLLGTSAGVLPPEQQRIAGALADVAAIGVLHERTLREADLVQAQLQRTLTARITIEQAKGVVAHTRGVGVDEAFTVLLAYAREHGVPLGDLARDVVERRTQL